MTELSVVSCNVKYLWPWWSVSGLDPRRRGLVLIFQILVRPGPRWQGHVYFEFYGLRGPGLLWTCCVSDSPDRSNLTSCLTSPDSESAVLHLPRLTSFFSFLRPSFLCVAVAVGCGTPRDGLFCPVTWLLEERVNRVGGEETDGSVLMSPRLPGRDVGIYSRTRKKIHKAHRKQSPRRKPNRIVTVKIKYLIDF